MAFDKDSLEKLLDQIAVCRSCESFLSLGPNPVVTADINSKIVIIGQAPGTKVHQSGIAWDDASGKQLRRWLDLSPEQFYDTKNIAIIPMGFCYPGKGASGDLPPRKECAPQWHQSLFDHMPNLELVILIGMYAQKYYLKGKAEKNLTETVAKFEDFGPYYFPLPHPSPRNRFWLTKNPWFETHVIPKLQERVKEVLDAI